MFFVFSLWLELYHTIHRIRGETPPGTSMLEGFVDGINAVMNSIFIILLRDLQELLSSLKKLGARFYSFS